jgi:hypothetical protein
MIIPGVLHFHALQEKPDEAARATAMCAAAGARNSWRVSLGFGRWPRGRTRACAREAPQAHTLEAVVSLHRQLGHHGCGR